MSMIPEKLYFKIGEVSKLTRIKPYVLRYWESHFKIVTPKKSGGKQRVYSRRDVELILYIKDLLKKEKLTLEGARKKVREFNSKKNIRAKEESKQILFPFSEKKFQRALKTIKKDLISIRDFLSSSK
ncbi:MAG: MerR family transcriptional regulator [Deltaproteobacteria bacterium]|nr:MerR family transcriptional regulator [Deltaproteobacteria bacterium]